MKPKQLMQVDILVRNFSKEGALSVPRLPNLESLLAVANRTLFEGSADAWVCNVFGVAKQQDFPIAPFSAKGEDLSSESKYWFCATPVHLEVARDSIVLSGMSQDLSVEEAQRLVVSLNLHFAEEGLVFFAPHPQRWYLCLNSTPAIVTTPLEQAMNRDISRLMPQGNEQSRWRSLLNEIQMLLYGHTVNQARELIGKSPANGLWVWGGGKLADVLCPYEMVLSDDVFFSGLAGKKKRIVPKGFADCRSNPCDGKFLVDLDAMDGWESLEQFWFKELVQALKSGLIPELTLWLATESRVTQYKIARRHLFKFWRKKQSLTQLLAHH